MYLSWRELLADLGYGFAQLIAFVFTVGSAIVAMIAFGSVVDGTARLNGDSGIFIVFTAASVFTGSMLWIGRGR